MSRVATFAILERVDLYLRSGDGLAAVEPPAAISVPAAMYFVVFQPSPVLAICRLCFYRRGPVRRRRHCPLIPPY